MKGIVYSFQECGCARHERVSKAAEICTITHFLGEDIRRIASATNVLNRYCFVCYPFTCSVLFVLDMAITFRCEIMTPVYACFVGLLYSRDGWSASVMG